MCGSQADKNDKDISYTCHLILKEQNHSKPQQPSCQQWSSNNNVCGHCNKDMYNQIKNCNLFK